MANDELDLLSPQADREHRKGYTSLIALFVAVMIFSNACIAFIVYFLVKSDSEPTPISVNEYLIDYKFENDALVALSAQVLPSIVDIRVTWVESGTEKQGKGTGVIFRLDDNDYPYILTNQHVIANYTKLHGKVSVRLHNSATYLSTEANVIGSDEGSDLAVLKLPVKLHPTYLKDFMVIEPANSRDLVYGQAVLALGNALGTGLSVSNGIVSNPELTAEFKVDSATVKRRVVQHTAPINSGNSGGALVNMKGELVAINTYKVTSTADGTPVSNISYAIPVNLCIAVADNIIRNNKYSGLKYTDLGIQEFAVQHSDTNNVETNYLSVSRVGACNLIDYPNISPKTGDIIVSFGGVAIEGYLAGTQLPSYAPIEEMLCYYGTTNTGSGNQLTMVVENSSGAKSTIKYKLYLQDTIPFI